MPSPSEVVLHALPIWLALVLLVPKRQWTSIRARLAATAAGERRHPFGPPLQPAEEISSRSMRLFAAELPRCLELGVPVWLATLVAEHRGFTRRRLAAVEHAASPAGWIWSRALGKITDEELERRLTDAGYPTPAAKVRLRSSLPYARWSPPWRASTTEEPNAALVRSANGRIHPPPLAAPRLSVQLLGRFRLRLGAEDLTTELLDRPTLNYLWLYLLIRAIQGFGPVPRAAVADEVYPGVDPKTQHERVRRRLYDLQHKLPALGRYVVVTDRDLQFDLEGCDVDVVEIMKLADEIRRNGAADPALLVASTVRSLEDALAACSDECLPRWDEWEDSINRGRGQSGEHLRALRARLAEARVLILQRLGGHYLAQKNTRRAVAVLDEAVAVDPGRDDLAELLARALEAAGEHARAADIRLWHVPRE